ncbi:MAG: carboxypeptidase-like regulatory domain-containing protein [Bacteroidales bacterium]|nr:carboxypeptidase-like regulatory domain-containing protein [Bacteroidales bacterium]
MNYSIIAEQIVLYKSNESLFPKIELIKEDKSTINGKITDKKGDPLSYATVFIANTTFGSITDKNGFYRLDRIPYGQHILVVSYVGFETSMVTIVVDKASIEHNVKLKQSTIKLDEVKVVEDKRKNKWNQNFKKFKDYFIGTTPNATYCEITNPQYLRFHFNKDTKTLTAESNEILIIENKALGYRIHYLLELFELRRNGSSIYLGKARFEPLAPANSFEAYEWKNNRQNAYYGSFRHFLTSLANNTLADEEFTATLSHSMIPKHKVYGKIPITKRERFSVGWEILISPRNFLYEKELRFNEYLHVLYKNEPEDNLYKKWQNPTYKLQSFQQSWIELQRSYAIFHVDGYLYNPTDIIFYGYWAWEKMAEAIPEDYFPNDD